VLSTQKLEQINHYQTHNESYLHVVEDEKERIGVELIEEFRRVQHWWWCQRVIWGSRTWIAWKIRSAKQHHMELLPLLHHICVVLSHN